MHVDGLLKPVHTAHIEHGRGVLVSRSLLVRLGRHPLQRLDVAVVVTLAAGQFACDRILVLTEHLQCRRHATHIRRSTPELVPRGIRSGEVGFQCGTEVIQPVLQPLKRGNLS